MSIYVEILIRGDMDNLWEKTQDPKLHQRWDLRFSEIGYLPRETGEPQKFSYATRIGAGLRIEGGGESTGERNDVSGERTSALKFWSKDWKSLIREGSGYWKYIPGKDGVRFLTWYDYRVRFGLIGKVIDRLIFRPLIGWATAWSFDRLRLWIEQGITPEDSRTQTVVYCIARLVVAFIWFYHGLVPKLLFPNSDELAMLRNVGIQAPDVLRAAFFAGLVELCVALAVVVFWRSKWPLWFTICAMIAALVGVSIRSPAYLTAAFNPVTFNLTVAALAAIALLTRKNIPTARCCKRKPRENP